MWKRLSYFLLRNLFIKIFAPQLGIPSEIITDLCSALYTLSNEMISMKTARRKFFERVDMLPLSREFNSACYSTGFRINTGIWANVSNEYQLENPQKSVFRTKPLVFVDDLPRKYHYSIENLILHITQVVSELTQVCGRMSAANTS